MADLGVVAVKRSRIVAEDRVRRFDGVRRRVERWSPRPLGTGPVVRLGILWFFVALAAVTAGRWPTAILWGVTAMLAARELLVVWWVPASRPDAVAGADATSGPDAVAVGDATSTTRPSPVVVFAATVLTVMSPIAAAMGTGFSGAVLLLVTVATAAVLVAARTGVLDMTPAQAAAFSTAVLLPTLPAIAVVLVTAANLWAGIFLVAAVSLYDAGYHISAAETSSLIEGPVTGIVGVLAVTFTMAIFQAPPFDTTSAAIAGSVCALCCPVGQWITTVLLPGRDAPCRALRRLDTYVLSAPAFLVLAWVIA